MISSEEIIGKAQALILSRLQERAVVDIPAIGVFQSLFHPEYILEDEGERLLIPPSISLSYKPSDYLLNAKHYTTLDQQPPHEYFASDFISNLSDLYSWDESEVSEVLTAVLKELLEGLFKGRRVTLLELGDLFVTEEVEGVLLLNFMPHVDLIQGLNTPFNIYKETKLRADIDFPDTEVRQSRLVEDSAFQYAIQYPEPTAIPESVSESEIIPSAPIEELNTTAQEEQKKKNISWMLWIALVALIALGVFLWLPKQQSRPVPEQIETAKTIAPPTDTIVKGQTTPTAPIAPLDTITVPKGGSLAAVAREYYQNAYYWVYVYIANSDSIPDPDNLQPGQTLIVPPLEWYDLKSNPADANKEAKAWATIILNRRYTSYEEQRPQLNIQP